MKLITLTGLFATFVAGAITQNANEFWVSTNTATANLGTLSDPYDGSTQVKFDAVMNGISANSTIHILAGTYQTKGFFAKSGQKIMGSGIDVTTLQFPSGYYVGGSGPAMICNSTCITNTEVCDLTCDCNIANNTDTYSGIILGGLQNAVRRVKVINCAHYGGNSEAWGIELTDFPPTVTDSTGNVIEDCEVSHFNYGGGGAISAITISDGSGIIRNNKVFLDGGSFAFNGSWTHDVLIEGNYVEGAASGLHGDTGGTTNLTMVHNTFIRCGVAADFGGTFRKNMTFAFNNIDLTNAPYSPQAMAFAFFPNGSYTNIFIFGNNVTCHLSAYNGIGLWAFLAADNVVGFVVANNTVDSTLTNRITNCSNLNMYDNTDVYGNYRSDLNVPVIGGVPVTQVGLNLVGSTTVSSALMNLGLPGNPSAFVTNNASQPVTFNTNLTVSGSVTAGQFVGGGSGLTGITASQVGAAASSQIPQKFASSEYVLTNASYSISTSHGLSGQPQMIRWVLVCKTNELGYVVGDEVSAGALVNSADNSKHPLEMTGSTAVAFVFSVNGGAMQLPNKTNPVAPVSLTSVSSVIKNWKLKCYATYLP